MLNNCKKDVWSVVVHRSLIVYILRSESAHAEKTVVVVRADSSRYIDSSLRTDALCPRVLKLDVEEMAHERLNFATIAPIRLHRLNLGKKIGLNEVVLNLAETLWGNLSFSV